MSQIPSSIGAANASANSSGQVTSALANVDIDQFLELMLAELQNQDPLDPIDNSEFLQQITQIREIGAADQLSQTLDAVLSGQNLATASGLIGKEISALSDDGSDVRGLVSRVSVEVDQQSGSRSLKVHVGESSFDIGRVREIVAPDSVSESS